MIKRNTLTEMTDKIRTGTVTAFYAVFLFFLVFITTSVMFGDVDYEYNHMGLFALVLLYVAAFVLISHLSVKYSYDILKNERLWLPIILSVVFAMQIILGYSLRFESAFDFASVYKGAVQWVETGTFSDYYDYYDWFPNNLGAMTLLYVAFKAANIFGITNFFAVGVFLNSAFVTLTMLFAYLSAKKISPDNITVRLSVLAFFLISPPFYIMGATFYTDSLSMLFPVMLYYIYLCLKESDNICPRKKKPLMLLIGVTAAVGTMIKSTVIIMAVAVLIDAVFDRKLRRAMCIFISICVCFMTVQFSLNSYLYTNHLDAELAAQKNTPIGHWIMMGLNPDSQGAYHPGDYTFTRSFTDTEKRDEEISKEIKKRIKDSGVSGLSRLFSVKLQKAFGDGTFALSDFLDDGPIEEGKLHDYVLYSGEYYYKYKYITQAPLLAAYIFAIIGTVKELKNALKQKNKFVLAPFVSLFGLMIFLAFWESSSRYFLNFVPIIYICGACGCSFLGKTKKRKSVRRSS